MKRVRLLLTIVSALIFTAAAQRCSAQLTPFLSLDASAKAAADKLAKDSLGADAMLTFIGAVGNIDTTLGALPIKSKFNPDDGTSGIWGYVYYSPTTTKSITIGVVKLPIIGPYAIPLDIQFPVVGVGALNVNATYANSDKMAARLRADTTFVQYRKDYPDQSADFLSLGNLPTIDSVSLPVSFDLSQSIWTVSFIGTGSRPMTCFVGAGDGTTYCRRVYAPTLAVPGEQDGAARGTADIVVAPNPANGLTRVSIDLPTGVPMGALSAALYNASGVKVLDFASDLMHDGFVEFDSHLLPAGVYFVRAVGPNWTGTKGVIVQK
jgi:hypothetical protein